MPTARKEQRFFKMSGSGNDFVVFSSAGAAQFEEPSAIRALSARGTGVGADGVVFLEKAGRCVTRAR
jgi:diaminopimelate epimerase